jgi:hypothetical protein
MRNWEILRQETYCHPALSRNRFRQASALLRLGLRGAHPAQASSQSAILELLHPVGPPTKDKDLLIYKWILHPLLVRVKAELAIAENAAVPSTSRIGGDATRQIAQLDCATVHPYGPETGSA